MLFLSKTTETRQKLSNLCHFLKLQYKTTNFIAPLEFNTIFTNASISVYIWSTFDAAYNEQ